MPVWIGIDEEHGKIVGQSCAMLEPIKIGTSVHIMGWGVDFFVLPEYRGRGIGYRLQRANYEENKVFMSLDMSDTTRHIKAKRELIPIGKVLRFVKLLRSHRLRF